MILEDAEDADGRIRDTILITEMHSMANGGEHSAGPRAPPLLLLSKPRM